MKAISIRIANVEAAMLAEAQKVNKSYRDLQGLLVSLIPQEYEKAIKGRGSRQGNRSIRDGARERCYW